MNHNLHYHLDKKKPQFPRLPRFGGGDYVTVGVPIGIVGNGAGTLPKFACGDRFRVLRVYSTSCMIECLRSLKTYTMEKADLVRW